MFDFHVFWLIFSEFMYPRVCQDRCVFSHGVLWWEGCNCGRAEARCQRGGQLPVDEPGASGKFSHSVRMEASIQCAYNIIFSLWSYRKIIRHIEHYPAKLISVLGFICRLLIASTKWGSTAWLWSRRTPYQKRRWVASTFLTQSSFS